MRSKRRKYDQSAEGRAAKQESIRRTKPWLQTRGPITESGKRRSSMNALTHGECSAAALRVRAECTALAWKRIIRIAAKTDATRWTK
jgi:hypothetical protein